MAEITHAGYLQLLAEIKAVIEQLINVEQQKLDAVHKADLVTVDECIRQEQAISLTMRSLDNRRDKMMPELGLVGSNLSNLAEHFPPELRDEAAKAAAALRSGYADYTSISEAARMALERGLREIDVMMQPAAASTEQTPQVPRPGTRPVQQLGQSAPPEGDVPHKKLDFGA